MQVFNLAKNFEDKNHRGNNFVLHMSFTVDVFKFRK
jgi:hypothetical protein